MNYCTLLTFGLWEGLPSPEDSVCPGGNSILLTSIIIIAEQVILVSGREIGLPFIETTEDLQKDLNSA